MITLFNKTDDKTSIEEQDANIITENCKIRFFLYVSAIGCSDGFFYPHPWLFQ